MKFKINLKIENKKKQLEFRRKMCRLKMLESRFDVYTHQNIIKNGRRHLFHIVDESPWPITMAFSIFIMFVGFVMYVHLHMHGGFLFLLGLLLVIYTSINWWRDVIREATFLGHHTSVVRKMMKAGMKLFIVTEVMFFFGFFWAFFHSSLAPAIWIGGIWPPEGFHAPTHKGIAVINTGLLIASAVCITLAHRAIRRNKTREARVGFGMTLMYAFTFLGFQAYEYRNLGFTIADGVYGSTFYMITGLHCFHVIAGTIFIIVCYLRFEKRHFSRKHHLGMLFAVWYWHFVDIVWIGLFFSVYWWGGKKVYVSHEKYLSIVLKAFGNISSLT